MHAVANSPPRTNHFGGNNHHHRGNNVKSSPTKLQKAPLHQPIDHHKARRAQNEEMPKPSLKRSRVLARSTQTHHLNGMQIILHADDSPHSHYHGNFRIVTGVEDDQVATPRNRVSSAVTRMLHPSTDEETASDYTLSDLFDGPCEESNPAKATTVLSPCLDDKLSTFKQHQNVTSSLVVHGSGIERSNDWDRPETIFQESTASLRHVPCTVQADSTGSPTPDDRLSEVAETEESSLSSHHQQQPSLQGSSAFFSGGHESEISIDPLNNFSPRKSTRAKAAAARRAAAEKLLQGEPLNFEDDSERHKSFESIQNESKGCRSQYSRYDDSLLVRKSRRSETKAKVRSKRKDVRCNTDRSPPRQTIRTRAAASRRYERKSNTNNNNNTSDNVVKKETKEPDNNVQNKDDPQVSGDSSCTLGNKSNSQEFAQLDLGDQQGIRMVNRAEVLTEEHGGLHERKAVVDVSPPPDAKVGFSGMLRSKMATFYSTTNELQPTQFPDRTTNNHHRPGLALFRTQSNRCVTKSLDPQRSSDSNDSSPKGAMMGLALRNHFTHFRAPRVESSTEAIPEDESIALEESAGVPAPPVVRASLFSNNLLTRLNESLSNLNHNNGAALLDDDESSFGFPG